METLFLTLSLGFLSYILYIVLKDFFEKRRKEIENKKITKELEVFNKNRNFPLSFDQYKTIYNFDHNPMFLLVCGKVGSGNQRDGDELITNEKRNSTSRISDHLSLHQKGGLTLSLGYDFIKKEHLAKFIKQITEILPDNSYRVFPLNKTWFIIAKVNSKIMINADNSIFNLN